MKSFAITIASILLALLAGCCSSPVITPINDNLTKEDILAIDKATPHTGGDISLSDEFVYNSPFFVIRGITIGFSPTIIDTGFTAQFLPTNEATGSITVDTILGDTVLKVSGSFTCTSISWKLNNGIEESVQLTDKTQYPYQPWSTDATNLQFVKKDPFIIIYEQIGKRFFDRKEISRTPYKVSDKALLLYAGYSSRTDRTGIDIILAFRRKKN